MDITCSSAFALWQFEVKIQKSKADIWRVRHAWIQSPSVRRSACHCLFCSRQFVWRQQCSVFRTILKDFTRIYYILDRCSWNRVSVSLPEVKDTRVLTHISNSRTQILVARGTQILVESTSQRIDFIEDYFVGRPSQRSSWLCSRALTCSGHPQQSMLPRLAFWG